MKFTGTSIDKMETIPIQAVLVMAIIAMFAGHLVRKWMEGRKK